MKGISDTNFKISSVNIEHRSKLDLRSGDTVRVWLKVEEKGKIRLQAFEGLVLARKHGSEPGATFTVRKIASGVGVERIFPLYSPNIDKIELIKRSKTRRSKLYYIRDKAAKEIRRKMRALSIDLPNFLEKKPEVKQEEVVESNDDNATEKEDTKEEKKDEEIEKTKDESAEVEKVEQKEEDKKD